MPKAPMHPSEPTLVVTTTAEPFAAKPVAPAMLGTPDVSVDPAMRRQAMKGFGGAFNEHGWAALQTLDAAARSAVMSALFDPVNGLRFNWCRSPIGASDYALERYTLDETKDDYSMAAFSIERDKQYLLPYIKAALAIRPDLKIWGSAWSPPTWMKTNGAFDSGAMRDEAKVYGAYALYLARYVESYAAEGVQVNMVVPQNEPSQLTNYPSCDWTPAQYVTFIRDHLAPVFTERKSSAKIYLGTINKPDWSAASVLADAAVASSVAGIALQWGGLAQIGALHSAFPSLAIMQSETECGNNYWEPGYDPNKPQNDFAYAAYTWRKFQAFIAGGADSYMLWNMVLDETGKSIDAVSPWPQNSAIVVDRTNKTVTYTPMFWATKHFSAFVDPGAHLVQSSGGFADSIAFQNPDGSIVVELLNSTNAEHQLQVSTGTQTFPVTLPASSFATLFVPLPA